VIGMVFKKGWNKAAKDLKDGVENGMSELKKEVEKNGKQVKQEVVEETVGLKDLMKRVFDVPDDKKDFVIEGKTDVDFLTGIWVNEHQRRSVKALISLRDKLKEEKFKNEKLSLELEKEKQKLRDVVVQQKLKLDKILEE